MMTPPISVPIAIVGAGAIGCRLAAHLHDAGIACDLFNGWQAHVAAIGRDGLLFERKGEQRRIPLRADSYDKTAAQYPFVFIAVRSNHTRAMLPVAPQLLAPGGVVVSCQNGLNEEEIAAAVGIERTLGCSMVFGARLAGPGHVQVLEGPDQLRVGGLEGVPPATVKQAAAFFRAAGTVTLTSNLIGYRWMKLVLNSTGDPLLLLTSLTGAVLHRDAVARTVMIGLTRETLCTAIAAGARPEPVMGVPVAGWLQDGPPGALHEALHRHGESLGERRLSMVADFEERGRTEVMGSPARWSRRRMRWACWFRHGAVASAVGALITGRGGEGVLRAGAAGAAVGGSAGAVQGAFRNDRPSTTYRNFVQRCLSERGFEVIGWN